MYSAAAKSLTHRALQSVFLKDAAAALHVRAAAA
jgi:hypothetical protein